MSEVWFTADLHFGHRGIIDHCRRPFRDVDEMDAEMIRRWNTCVSPGDRVYLLGDVSFRKVGETIDILDQLQGQKYLVAGNHDKALRKRNEFCDQFVWVKDLASVKIEGQKVVLCHFPLRSWDRMNHGSWHLHGHCHGSLADDMGKLLDVGVDHWSYAPVSFGEIVDQLDPKPFVEVDHHKRIEGVT